MENHYDEEDADWVTMASRYAAIEEQPRFRELDTHLYSHPHLAWPLLLELLAEVPDDLVFLVGCGPLETFINRHGAAFVDQLECEARENERFREAIVEVNLRQGKLPAPVESRLVAAFGRRFELLPRLEDE